MRTKVPLGARKLLRGFVQPISAFGEIDEVCKSEIFCQTVHQENDPIAKNGREFGAVAQISGTLALYHSRFSAESTRCYLAKARLIQNRAGRGLTALPWSRLTGPIGFQTCALRGISKHAG